MSNNIVAGRDLYHHYDDQKCNSQIYRNTYWQCHHTDYKKIQTCSYDRALGHILDCLITCISVFLGKPFQLFHVLVNFIYDFFRYVMTAYKQWILKIQIIHLFFQVGMLNRQIYWWLDIPHRRCHCDHIQYRMENKTHDFALFIKFFIRRISLKSPIGKGL